MKLLIVHLSDIHLSEQTFPKDKTEALARAITSHRNVDRIIICITGDIAFDGIDSNYNLAEQFLSLLIDELKKNHKESIPILVVPGNHDFCYNTQGARTRTDIIRLLCSHVDKKKLIDREQQHLKAFYQFANRHHCFSDTPKSLVEVIDSSFLRINDISLRINLINSAILSTKKDDKGIHYLPNYETNKLYKNANYDFTITLSHHTLEWFEEDSKKRFYDAISKNTSILLLGHEHNPSGESITKDNKDEFIRIDGGRLSKEGCEESAFNLIEIDTSTEHVVGHKYSWNTIHRFYASEIIIDQKIRNTNRSPARLSPSTNFIDFIKEDNEMGLNKNFQEYFVFPKIERRSNEDFSGDLMISTLSDCIDEIDKRKHLLFEGDDKCGKTALAKYLYLALMKESSPLFFNTDMIRNREMRKVVENTFKEQYSEDPVLFEKYMQLDFESRVAIIDDVQTIKQEQLPRLIECFKDVFGKIILFSKSEWDFDILKRAQEKANMKTVFEKYHVMFFYSDKRKQLISKVASLLDDTDFSMRENRVTQLNNYIHQQIQLFSLDPGFIIQFVRFYYDKSATLEVKNTELFGTVFENNIINALRMRVKKHSLDEALTVLEEVAYYIHFNKKYPLSYESYRQIVSFYNEEYDLSVPTDTLFDQLISAKIFKIAGHDKCFRFSSNNYLAYFVARKLNRKFHQDGELSDLQYILNNICFGINGDIIIFLSYLTKNLKMLQTIYAEADEMVRDWDTYCLDTNNFKYLSGMSAIEDGSPPSKQDKENHELVKAEQEQQFVESERIITVELYDYDESEIYQETKQIMKALKLSEMIATILPSFYFNLKKEQKNQFVAAIYSNPNKIIEKLFRPIDTIISESNDEESDGASDDELIELLQDMTIAIMLSIYDRMAMFAITNKTKPQLVNSKLITSSTHAIQQLMMLENGDFENEFIETAIKLFESSNFMVQNMVTKIVRKYLLTHNTIQRQNEQKLHDKFFPKSKKALLFQKRIRVAHINDD